MTGRRRPAKRYEGFGKPGSASAKDICRSWASVEGSPHPLGPTWIEAEQAFNFALYSEHAEHVTLMFYRPDKLRDPAVVVRLSHLRNKSGRVWHCRVPAAELNGATYYAYGVGGPPPDGHLEWHAFDEDKVLLDPYAPGVFIPSTFDRAAAVYPGSNAGTAILGILPQPAPFDWGDDRSPYHESDLVIYELHVRGFTMSATSAVPEPRRGTFLGVIDKIPYLKELGITAVELMPIFQFDPLEGNYWGYSPISFFAPHSAYHAGPTPFAQCNEFKEMVRALHAARIEVILDVVYNHTGEGNQDGPTYSFKGIDNSTYYLMSGNPEQPYLDVTGTGNTLHVANRYVRQLVVESMLYWVREMHVDGFRLDLACSLARNSDGSFNSTEPPILGDIMSHRELARTRLIVEPWDTTAYHLGRAFPSGLAWQWNGRFRDGMRRFLRGDPGMVSPAMTRLYGSDDLFPDGLEFAYHPYQSVNYVTSHDGFTLYDLLAYHHKRNWANGHDNMDGPAEEYGWNCGWEGDDGVPADVRALRVRQAKNLFCLLLLANGTPMIRAGDEFLQTQGGNSNPYNQDNETTWLDWRRAEEHIEVLRFVKCMVAFRRAHPSLARSRFWRDDVSWHGLAGPIDLARESQSFAFCVRGSTERDDDLYVAINASPLEHDFVPQAQTTDDWACVVDTAQPSTSDFRERGGQGAGAPPPRQIAPRSVVVLVQRRRG